MSTKVKMVWERIKNPDVISYEILSTTHDTRIQERVFVVENPTDTNPVQVSSKFVKNDNVNTDKYTQVFQLKHHNILLDENHFLSAELNGQPFDRKLLSIHRESRKVYVYYELLDDDVLTINYAIDGVEFEFLTQEPHNEYAVKPMVDDLNSLVGKHNVLI